MYVYVKTSSFSSNFIFIFPENLRCVQAEGWGALWTTESEMDQMDA